MTQEPTAPDLRDQMAMAIQAARSGKWRAHLAMLAQRALGEGGGV